MKRILSILFLLIVNISVYARPIPVMEGYQISKFLKYSWGWGSLYVFRFRNVNNPESVAYVVWSGTQTNRILNNYVLRTGHSSTPIEQVTLAYKYMDGVDTVKSADANGNLPITITESPKMYFTTMTSIGGTLSDSSSSYKNTGPTLNISSQSTSVDSTVLTATATPGNSIVIGQNEYGKGSNTTLIGTPATTANYFYGAITTTGALLGNSASITNNVAAGGIITAKNISATGQLSIADTVVTSNFTISSTHSLYICNSSSGITATMSTTDVNWNGSPLVIIKNIGTGTVTLTNTWTSDPTTIAAGASEMLAMVDISGTTYWIKIN